MDQSQKEKWVSYKKLYESNLLSKKIQAQLCLGFCMSVPDVSLYIANDE